MRRITLSLLVCMCLATLLSATSAVNSSTPSTLTPAAPVGVITTAVTPTITALPLVPKSRQFDYEPSYLRSLYAIIPKKMGEFTVLTGEQAYMNDTAFVLKNRDGSRYIVKMMVYTYQLNTNTMLCAKSLMNDPQALNVADGAYISNGGVYIAVVQYRNVQITIQGDRIPVSLPSPTLTPIPVSAVQWMSVLQDIKAWLDHGVLP